MKKLFARIEGDLCQPMVDNLETIKETLLTDHSEFILEINSRGGSVSLAMKMVEILEEISPKACKIITSNIGICESSSVCVYCAGHERWCIEEGTFLLHEARMNRFHGETEEQYYSANMTEKRTKTVKVWTNWMVGVISKTTGSQIDETARILKEESTLNFQSGKDHQLVHFKGKPYFGCSDRVLWLRDSWYENGPLYV